VIQQFTLDTSGAVLSRSDHVMSGGVLTTVWSDLSPFAQGYVEAMFAALDLTVDEMAKWLDGVDPYRLPSFSDLAPETLALILRDCAAYERGPAMLPADRAGGGATFWRDRQSGFYLRETAGVPFCGAFPPLTPYLGDDGKVYLREAA
jgi:hypothetical protein